MNGYAGRSSTATAGVAKLRTVLVPVVLKSITGYRYPVADPTPSTICSRCVALTTSPRRRVKTACLALPDKRPGIATLRNWRRDGIGVKWSY